MLHSACRPAALVPGAEPSHFDRGYAHDYHPQPLSHHTYASAHSTSSASSSSAMAPHSDRFEHKRATLIASLLESRLATNPLVRDCSVIGVPQSGGLTITSSYNQVPIAGTVPVAFVALSSAGRERSAQGGDKESKRMKTELLKWLIDFAPAFKQMKGKLMFVESIPRGGPTGSVLRHLLVEKATSPPAPSPDKGFFNTVLSEPSTPAGPSKTASLADPSEISGPPKKAVRDSKRRATHSQIERRRREKINDRLVTLRSIVPACAKELEDRRRQKQEEEDEAARIAAGGAPKTYIDAATGKPKRKRNRKKPDTKKQAGGDKEEELGLHKLEVLTHAINYIFELKAHIQRLETGAGPEHVPTADNPFGVRNKDGSYRQDAKVEDEPGCGMEARVLGSEGMGAGLSSKVARPKDEEEDQDEGEDEEVDQIEDDPTEEAGEGDDEDEADDDQDDDDDEPLQRRSKKHMSSTTRPASTWAPSFTTTTTSSSSIKSDPFTIPTRYRRTDTAISSSSSSRESAEVSPAFSLIQASPSTTTTISPATTVTSPMMSLCAESPILLPDPAISLPHKQRRVSQSPAFPSLPSSALPLPHPLPPASRRESSSFLFKQLTLTSPNFPPTNPSSFSSSSTTTTTRSLPFPTHTTYGEESEVRETTTSTTPGLSDASDAHNAAALLLNFSTSPEVLRPITSPRPTVPLPTRSTFFSSPHYRPLHSQIPSTTTTTTTTIRKQDRHVTDEQEVEPLDLNLNLDSPPHLALDSSPDTNADQDDRMSDKTVEDPLLTTTCVKVEAQEVWVEMDTTAK
ncbi:uncharacterized protein UTRI_05984 [Ustilago trichophora]|uniref:BHLH domain-containing protein n=1 Tax=Ustilago trichophora TaxID=86804 RepID=A0A5C3EJA5_9BASI|nr:uncharacterized protein UTRI_05984 [Ustilago trichophora]